MDIVSIIFGNLAIIAVVGVLLAIGGGVLVVAQRYKTVPPNKALIVSGRRGTRIVTGGGTLVLPVVEDALEISLEVMTVDIKKEDVHTSSGVTIDITGVVQFRVSEGNDAILTASTSFLSQGRDAIRSKLEETIDGHLRAICGTMSPIELVVNREKFSDAVVVAADKDLAKFGVSLISLTIKNISDKKGYYNAWGTPDIAKIDKEARVAKAEADKEARQKEALADQEATKQEKESEALRAEYEKDAEIKKASYKQAIEQKQAIAEQAKPIENAKQRQILKEEEMMVSVIEQEKQIEVSKHKKAVREQDGEAMKVYTVKVAEGKAEEKTLEGKGEGEKEKAILIGKAEGTRAQLLAEAEGTEKRALALQKLDDAGLKVELMKYLPEMVESAGEAVNKIGNVTVIQSGGDADSAPSSPITDSIVDLVTKVPPILAAYGIDISKIVEGDSDELKKLQRLKKKKKVRPNNV